MPQPTSSSSKSAKSKKKFILHGLKKKDLISLLKQSRQDDEKRWLILNESKASFKASFANDDNSYYPYDETLFGHDPIATPDLTGYNFLFQLYNCKNTAVDTYWWNC